jgi:hypothetical protein
MFNATDKAGVKKFATGESRYCQNCGKESHSLFEVIQDTKLKMKLMCCKECSGKL